MQETVNNRKAGMSVRTDNAQRAWWPIFLRTLVLGGLGGFAIGVFLGLALAFVFGSAEDMLFGPMGGYAGAVVGMTAVFDRSVSGPDHQ